MFHREVFEQGKRAFVSFVHFYYKHECRLIFQAKGTCTCTCVLLNFRLLYSNISVPFTRPIDNLVLDLVGLAIGYGLPHLPKMPELKDKDTSRFISHTISASSIPYKDKAREKKRKQQLLQKQGTAQGE